jgi:uncharacterized protein YbaR (Trm112 family)
MPEQDDKLVDETFACPQCRERDVDKLAIHPDETVTCRACGRVYLLPGIPRSTYPLEACPTEDRSAGSPRASKEKVSFEEADT